MRSSVWLMVFALIASCSADADDPSPERQEKTAPAKGPATRPASRPTTSRPASTSLTTVPGTSVILVPPPGYVAAKRFTGFQKDATGASIMVSEIPSSMAQVTAAYRDPARVAAQGMTLVSTVPATVGGCKATLMQATQRARGMLFRKWLLAVDRSGSTTFIVANFPEAMASEEEVPLKEALLAATFGAAADPEDALKFTVTPEPPFAVAKVMGQMMILSPQGRFPAESERVPLMVVGMSHSDDLSRGTREAFAEVRVKQSSTVKDIEVVSSRPITVGPLTGIETLAKGKGKKESTPITLYQVILFEDTGYCLLQGLTPTATKDEHLPAFSKTATSFRLK